MRRLSSTSLIALLAAGAFVALVGSAGTAAASCASNPTCNPYDPSTGPCCDASTCEWKTNGSQCEDLNDCVVSTTCNNSHLCVGGSNTSNGNDCRERALPGGIPKNCKKGTCTNGVCGNLTDQCDDGIACTDDCQDTPSATCYSLPHPYSATGTPCDADSNICTIDQCNASHVCAFVSNLVCPSTNPPECRFDKCEPTTGQCDRADKAYDTPCTADNNQCSKDICNGGTCTHPAWTGHGCTDGNSCTSGDVCDSNKNCNGTPLAENAACDSDNNTCTFDYCAGTPRICNHSYINPFTGGNTQNDPCSDGRLCSDGTTCDQGACLGGGAFCNGATYCPACQTQCNTSAPLPACGCSF